MPQGTTGKSFKDRLQSSSSAESKVSVLSPFKGERSTIMLASIVINLLALAFPLLMLQLYDRILPNQSIDTLTLVAGTVAFAVAVEAILRIARSYSTAWISARFEHRAMMAVAERFLAEPLHQFERKGTGALMDRFKSISTLKYHYSGQTFQQLMDLPFTVLYVLIVLLMSPWLGLLLIVGYSIFSAITWNKSQDFPELVKEQKNADLRRSNFLNETLNNVHTLKSMTMESLMLRRHERLQENSARLMARMTYALDMSSGLGNIFSPLMTMLTVAVGAWLVIDHQMTNGELAACVLLGMRSLAPLQRLGGIWTKHQQDDILRDELAKVLSEPPLPPQSKDNVYMDDLSVQKPYRSSKIEFENISYQFPGADQPIFENFSMTISPGDCVTIVGAGGSGRSTLLQLMAGILTPDQGRILIDGDDLKSLDLEEAGELIGYLPQNTQMFEGSLLDNASLFNPARINRALMTAKSLGLGDFVAKMPRGWDSIVGDMASDSLPPGYRQRIAIVRALSNQPNIILFDDATSTIDAEGDALFLKFLDSMKGKVTIVMVTQRPSYQKLASRVLYLRDGKLTEMRPNELPVLDRILSQPNTETQDEVRQSLVHTSRPGTYSQIPADIFFDSPLKYDLFEDGRWEKMHETVCGQFTSHTDFAGCLTILLRLLNSSASAREVAESLPYFTSALDLTGFHNSMAQLGFRMKEVRCKLGSIESRSLPCLFVPDHDLAFVAIARSGRYMRVSNDQNEVVHLEKDLNMEGRAFFYEAVDYSVVHTNSWVSRAILRFSSLIGQATLSALVSGLVMMAGPLFLTVVYSTVIPSGAKDSLLYLSIGACIALLSGYFFMRHRARILAYIAGRIEYLFGATILQQVLRMSPIYTERASVGSQMSRLQSFEAIRDMFIGPLASTLLEFPATLVLLVLLSIMNPIALTIFLIMVGVYLILYWIFSAPTRQRVSNVSLTATKRNSFLVDMISKMRVIRECGAQRLWLERFREISADATMASFKAEYLSSIIVGVSYFVMMCAALAIVSSTVPAVWSGAISSGALIASLMLMWRVLGPIQTVFTNMTRVERVASAVRQIDALMKIQGERPNETPAISSRTVHGSIEFARVSFRYSMNVDPALVGVEFKVNPGELVAITGANGGGKSTLLKMILGMYQPQAGAVLIDNVDIRQMDPMTLRRMIGYVPQDIQLFRASIIQNLRLAKPDATDNEVFQALEMAGALDQVLQLPRGLQYRVGDNTNELSTSLIQKISLARAYLTRAPIMLFDEPGAGLDELGDKYFMETLMKMKGHTTVIYISHRPSHIRLADTILVFDKGYLRAAGPPAVLLRKPTAA
ncbi:ATP-binding cassette domain-containing protein [Orrella sp. NBD-18]|uniref:ATP-binding cassette domain-containing protein n=1 Tax=Sheuella amnicola TaxID=2707330 RepID=A0A6B2R2N0_9BURK|nr:ATP-binding cassette domain-containing protein [Sheuella amnicola]NDY84373.1 ATP-binding cassette domain-containing protein [Sheuella amnicola]